MQKNKSYSFLIGLAISTVVVIFFCGISSIVFLVGIVEALDMSGIVGVAIFATETLATFAAIVVVIVAFLATFTVAEKEEISKPIFYSTLLISLIILSLVGGYLIIFSLGKY